MRKQRDVEGLGRMKGVPERCFEFSKSGLLVHILFPPVDFKKPYGCDEFRKGVESMKRDGSSIA
jgi:hypothetical protein